MADRSGKWGGYGWGWVLAGCLGLQTTLGPASPALAHEPPPGADTHVYRAGNVEPVFIAPQPYSAVEWDAPTPSSPEVDSVAFYQPKSVDDVVGNTADPEIQEYIRRSVRRPSLSPALFVTPHARIPGYGPLGDLLESGYGAGIHAFFPYSEPLFITDRSAWFYGAEIGFDYSFFEGKRGVNVHVPGGSDSIVHNADMYLFDLGLSLGNARQVLGTSLIWYNAFAVKGIFGGIAADMKANVFDPADKQVLAFDPQEDAFLRGGRLEWRSGILLPNGYTISGYGSGDFLTTEALTGRNLDTGLWTVGASIEIPLQPVRQMANRLYGRW